MATERNPQISAVVNKRLHDLFAELISKNFVGRIGKPIGNSEFVRNIVCETITIYGNIDPREAAEIDDDLLRAAILGPVTLRKMMDDWKAKQANQPAGHEPDQAKREPSAA